MRITLLPSLLFLLTPTLAALGGGGDRVFMPSAQLQSDHSVRLPVREGRVGDRVIWYVVLDASDGDAAKRFGSNRSQKLAHVRGSGAAQAAAFGSDGLLHFTATVDFRPERVVVPDPVLGFPPLEAAPGAVGEEGYSPLVELPDGTVLNAPHLANDTGQADKVVRLDLGKHTVDYALTDGLSRKERVVYMSTDASDPVGAALENVTFAPKMNAAPKVGEDGTDQARTSLAALTNGPTGVDNPERQGLNSALLGEGDPLNVLAWMPNQGRYSPLWDVHLTTFDTGIRPRRITEFAAVEKLAEKGQVTAPDGSRWAATGFIVNCPIVAQLDH